MENDEPFKHRNHLPGYIVEPSLKTNRFLKVAKNMATQSSYGKIRHGAVLVKGGSIISTSFNKDKFSAFGERFRKQGLGPATHHAELGCVLGIDRSKTVGSTIYVVRINKKGEYRLSKPCPMCHEILKFCGVKKVVYTKNENEIECYKL
tara:strand:+ start:380 stop:826 length:447 start_codon:yes stop_codon:yes gene_type:complete